MTTVGNLFTKRLGRTPMPAKEIRELCLTGNEQTFIRRRIVGRLDLAGAYLRKAIRFVDCEFDDRIDLRDVCAEETLEWVGGRLTSLMADHLESKGHVTLTDVVCGAVALRQAHIEGDLRLTNSLLRVPHGTALEGRGLRIDGSLFLEGDGQSSRADAGLRVEGELHLMSADIKGSVDCRNSTFENPFGKSINGFDMSVGAEFLLEEGFVANGEVYLERATVDRLRASGGTFRKGSGRWALHADTLQAKSGIFLNDGFRATGAVRLVGANITGELCCTGGIFHNPGGAAFDATRLRADDVYLDHGFQAYGAVLLSGAHLTRQLNCTAGSFQNENGFALDCDGLQCAGEVFLNQGFNATGEVRLIGAQITNELNCTGGRFDNPAGKALYADGLTTPGNIFLNSETGQPGFRALGEVRLARATVGRQLKLSGAALSNPGDLTLDLSGLVAHGDVLLEGCHSTGFTRMRGATIDRDLRFDGAELRDGLEAVGVSVGATFTWRVSDMPRGDVDLSFVTVRTFDDTLLNWPEGRVILAGFTCQAPAGYQLTPEQWITWLGKTRRHYSDAYEHFATAYRLGGEEAAAKKISIARQQDLRHRGDLGKPARVWNWLLDKSTSYGYNLHRPVMLLLTMAVIGAVIFGVADLYGKMSWIGSSKDRIPPFQPVVYTIQTLIPGPNLAQTSNWLPNATTAWGMAVMGFWWFAVVVGWMASFALIAGASRFFRQQS